MDLRCESGKKQAELVEPGIIEIKCDNRYCGARKGVVVLHQFDAMTGEMIRTRRYKNPERGKENAVNSSAPVRTA